MWETLLGAGTGVYILWGMGLLGLLLKLMANTHMKKMIKASENMATTKKKCLRVLRQKYENGRSLGIHNGDGQAYVEKNVRSMRFVSMPLDFWRLSGRTLCCGVCMVIAGTFLFKDVSWRGSPEMVTLIANGIIVCAFLIAVENIFLINNKIEILKANIRDYLQNLPVARENPVRAPAGGINIITEKNQEQSKDNQEDDEIKNQTAATESTVSSVYHERDSNEEALNCFLKEFFS